MPTEPCIGPPIPPEPQPQPQPQPGPGPGPGPAPSPRLIRTSAYFISLIRPCVPYFVVAAKFPYGFESQVIPAPRLVQRISYYFWSPFALTDSMTFSNDLPLATISQLPTLTVRRLPSPDDQSIVTIPSAIGTYSVVTATTSGDFTRYLTYNEFVSIPELAVYDTPVAQRAIYKRVQQDARTGILPYAPHLFIVQKSQHYAIAEFVNLPTKYDMGNEASKIFAPVFLHWPKLPNGYACVRAIPPGLYKDTRTSYDGKKVRIYTPPAWYTGQCPDGTTLPNVTIRSSATGLINFPLVMPAGAMPSIITGPLSYTVEGKKRDYDFGIVDGEHFRATVYYAVAYLTYSQTYLSTAFLPFVSNGGASLPTNWKDINYADPNAVNKTLDDIYAIGIEIVESVPSSQTATGMQLQKYSFSMKGSNVTKAFGIKSIRITSEDPYNNSQQSDGQGNNQDSNETPTVIVLDSALARDGILYAPTPNQVKAVNAALIVSDSEMNLIVKDTAQGIPSTIHPIITRPFFIEFAKGRINAQIEASAVEASDLTSRLRKFDWSNAIFLNAMTTKVPTTVFYTTSQATLATEPADGDPPAGQAGRTSGFFGDYIKAAYYQPIPFKQVQQDGSVGTPTAKLDYNQSNTYQGFFSWCTGKTEYVTGGVILGEDAGTISSLSGPIVAHHPHVAKLVRNMSKFMTIEETTAEKKTRFEKSVLAATKVPSGGSGVSISVLWGDPNRPSMPVRIDERMVRNDKLDDTLNQQATTVTQALERVPDGYSFISNPDGVLYKLLRQHLPGKVVYLVEFELTQIGFLVQSWLHPACITRLSGLEPTPVHAVVLLVKTASSFLAKAYRPIVPLIYVTIEGNTYPIIPVAPLPAEVQL